MTNEYDIFQKNIRSIVSQDFNTAHSLIGTIVNYTSDMKYCDVEVRMKGGVHTFANVPAHGYPVKGSSGVIHFHDGHLQQPFCDCEYRMNPPDKILKECVTSNCFNWVNNGDFTFGTEGFTGENGTEGIVLHEDCFTDSGKGCVLEKEGSYIEFNVDLSECKTRYFKFQCYYRGLNYLKIECFDTSDNNRVIQNLPETMSHDYKLWSSPYGRFKWAYNKETYPFINEDLTLNNKIKIRITNTKNPNNNSELTITEEDGSISTRQFNTMQVDGLLVFSENGDTSYYKSQEDMLKLHKLIQE